jgi:serine/threonine protein kinase
VGKATLNYVGPYRLLNPVNTGQTSQMWQAYHDGLQRFFAIKTLLDKFQRDREQIGYLRWEYTVGSKMLHERIIRIEEFAVDRGKPYLAMEWFAAPNMKQLVRQGIEGYVHLLPKIALEAAEALVYFNGQGWVHRDIKPDNFLVNEEGDVKLIDFALARRKRGLLSKLLAPKTKIQGTRSYMSPEQIRGAALDERSDVYSLGCTLFELIGGKPPFTGTSANELLTKHLRAATPSLESANREVTPEFSGLIRRAMSKKVPDRPKSMNEFYTEMKATRIFKRDPTPPKQVAPQDD